MRNEQLPRSTDDPGAGPTQVITCVADIARVPPEPDSLRLLQRKLP